MSIKLIVGLRNPGQNYHNTRHNAGEWLVQAYAESNRLTFHLEKKFQSEIASISLENHTIALLLPTTFMNHSGQPVQAMSQFYRIKPEEILVVHDDLDLPVGCIKLKKGGGHGGHNGLRDIIAQIGADFYRLRIGIGHPGHKDQVVHFVLSHPSSEDKQTIMKTIHQSIEVMPLILTGRMSEAMNQLHKG